MKILLHSSKTMKPVPYDPSAMTPPRFIGQAKELHAELARFDADTIASVMKVSHALAKDVHSQIKRWHPDGTLSPAALTFRGDIYSGLRAQDWDATAREYATSHLWILSGLYGILRPYDGIYPYRLEMGYRLQVGGKSLYEYWNDALAPMVAAEDVYVNVTADEYLRAIKKSLGHATVITPKFLTVSPKTDEPVFVTVHAKIARGAFANWLITRQIESIDELWRFDDLGYRYDSERSTNNVPVFVCKDFKGIGLSTRLA